MSHSSEGCLILINFVKSVWSDNERNEKQIPLFRNIKDIKLIPLIDCHLFVFSINPERLKGPALLASGLYSYFVVLGSRLTVSA